MARITIEDCLEKIPSRFQLVHMAAKRVRQIREGSEYLVSSPKNEDIVVALREIAADRVRIKTVEIEVETEELNETQEASEALEIPETQETPETEVTA
ncbi:MAG: DNA-directed RNA polymerase subunit omega [Desulfobacterales bacterium]|nr:DNA-directed RNA polymerase subunit omega [Desulfobacterales bacterium]MDX2512052.1 DNA-directed RNA polymerase subunit omega [Desulfobacterales bacterium]